MITVKLFFAFLLVLVLSSTLFSQGIAINISGADPDPSAVLDVSATNMGVLIPRLSTLQRDAINVTGNPEGVLVFNTDRCCFEFYTNGSWHGMGCPCDDFSQVTFTYRGSAVTYGTVENNCKCWLDRNLGASQVATSSTDHLAYGDLFQWGRLADGHQLITWTAWNAGAPDNGTTATLSPNDTPGHANFITNGTDPYDWLSAQNDNLWQGASCTNNPCPSGWRIPTSAEWTTERLSWISNDATGAINSPLKLSLAGRRSYSNGILIDVGLRGHYCSSTVNGALFRYLYFDSSDVNVSSSMRVHGFSVRCIKN